MTDVPPDPLGERIAKLEGAQESEERLIEHDLDSARHGQLMLAGIVALVVAGSLAMLVYVLQRLDTIQSTHELPAVVAKR